MTVFSRWRKRRKKMIAIMAPTPSKLTPDSGNRYGKVVEVGLWVSGPAQRHRLGPGRLSHTHNLATMTGGRTEVRP